VINGMTLDGQTKDCIQQAVRDAPFSFMAAMAEAHKQLRLRKLSEPELPLRSPMGALTEVGTRASIESSWKP